MQPFPFPIFVYPSLAVRRMLGPDTDKVAALALRAVLKNRRSLEIAHQQVQWRSRHFAFSSRIGSEGDLILELDIGDPRLEGRVVLEEDMKRIARAGRDKAKPVRRQ
jgi:hypothetical protein